MYRRKRKRKAFTRTKIALIHHPGSVFFEEQEVSIPSQSAHGSTPRQLCGTVSVRQPVPEKAYRLRPDYYSHQSKEADYSHRCHYRFFHHHSFFLFPTAAHFAAHRLHAYFCAFDASLRSFDARVGRVGVGLFVLLLNL